MRVVNQLKLAVVLTCVFRFMSVLGEEPKEGQIWAVVVGISNYQDLSYRPLRYAVKDASELRKFLLSSDGGGLKSTNIKYLENATVFEMDDILPWLKNRVHKKDRILVFFSGHGDQVENSNGVLVTYLVPSDGRLKHLKRTGVDLSKFWKKLSGLEAHQVALIVDCCYSGIVSCQESGSTLKASIKKTQKLADIKLETTVSNRVMISSCGAQEQAMEISDYRQSAFTFYLLQGLAGGKADINQDGGIDLSEAFEYLQKKVTHLARRHQHTQTPRMFGKLQKPFFIKRKLEDQAFDLFF